MNNHTQFRTIHLPEEKKSVFWKKNVQKKSVESSDFIEYVFNIEEQMKQQSNRAYNEIRAKMYNLCRLM